MTPEERLREVTARLRAQAATLPAGEAIGSEDAPEAGPAAEERSAELHRELVPPEPRGTAAQRVRLQIEAGEVAARSSACARLRALLSDGAWHSAVELVDAGGLRFGARIFELRRGDDGRSPLDVEGEQRDSGGRARWFYRARCRND